MAPFPTVLMQIVILAFFCVCGTVLHHTVLPHQPLLDLRESLFRDLIPGWNKAVKYSPMRQRGGCNVISWCLVRKEETTLKVFRNTAVDGFLKRVWKNKRFQNLTAEVFWWKSWAGMKDWNPMADRHFALAQFMSQLPLLCDHSSSQTRAGALQCQHPSPAFPPHSHSAEWEFPTVL